MLIDSPGGSLGVDTVSPSFDFVGTYPGNGLNTSVSRPSDGLAYSLQPLTVPGMRLPAPIALVCVPIACTAMWLTTAVAQAQGDGPGITPGLVTQVAKPVVKQVAAATSSTAATVQHAASTASNTTQHAAATVQRAPSVAQAVTASQPTAKPVRAVPLPEPDVPAIPPRIALAALPLPLADVPPTSVPPTPPTEPEAVDVPAVVTTIVEEVDAVADDAVVVDAAIPPSLEALEADAVPRVAASAIRHVESVVETAVEQAVFDSAPSPPAAAEPSAPEAPAASREPVASHEDSSPAPSSSTGMLEPGASIAAATMHGSIAQSAPKPSSISISRFETQIPSAPIAESAAYPRPISVTDDAAPSRAPSAAVGTNRWSVLGLAQSLRFVDDGTVRTSPSERSAPPRSASTPYALLVVSNTVAAFDTPRPR